MGMPDRSSPELTFSPTALKERGCGSAVFRSDVRQRLVATAPGAAPRQAVDLDPVHDHVVMLASRDFCGGR